MCKDHGSVLQVIWIGPGRPSTRISKRGWAFTGKTTMHFAGSPRPGGARGAGSRREIPLVLGCGVMYFDQDWLFDA